VTVRRVSEPALTREDKACLRFAIEILPRLAQQNGENKGEA